RDNPALLKLDLYCRGIRLDDSCLVDDDGGRPLPRTRAGLGSGLEAILPGGLWTNVPVSEPFPQKSPYTLHRTQQGSYWIHRRGERIAPIDLSTRTESHERAAPPGRPLATAGGARGRARPGKADDAHRHAAGHLPRHLSGEGLRVLD